MDADQLRAMIEQADNPGSIPRRKSKQEGMELVSDFFFFFRIFFFFKHFSLPFF